MSLTLVETLGDFVRRIRRDKNLTLRQVSDRSARFGKRISAGYANRIENDPTLHITADRLKALAHGLDVPAEDLFACALSKTAPVEINPPYRIDLINAQMGAQRLSN